MTEQTVAITEETIASAVKNEWGKTFTLGDREFEIKDLGYFDYVEFVALAKPLMTVAMNGLEMTTKDGEIGVDFNPAAVDLDQIIAIAGKELPKLAHLVCKQSDAKIKVSEVAELARRPQRLLEVVLMQIMHNKMIEEFASFFQRLAAMTQALLPDAANLASTTPESKTEETHSS